MNTNIKSNKEERDAFIKKCKNRTRNHILQKEYGVSKQTIINWKREVGVLKKRTKRPW